MIVTRTSQVNRINKLVERDEYDVYGLWKLQREVTITLREICVLWGKLAVGKAFSQLVITSRETIRSEISHPETRRGGRRVIFIIQEITHFAGLTCAAAKRVCTYLCIYVSMYVRMYIKRLGPGLCLRAYACLREDSPGRKVESRRLKLKQMEIKRFVFF